MMMNPIVPKGRYYYKSSQGSVLLLAVTIGLLLVIGVICLTEIGCLFVFQRNSHSATEAAALACAQDLSRIVVEDPHFGFVSITDQAPGSRTVSSSGLPISVHGINTILAGIRQNRILAAQLGNQWMMQLTDEEFQAAKSTIKLLKSAFKEAADSKSGGKLLALDVDGQSISLCETAVRVYVNSSGNDNKNDIIADVKLGITEGGGSTITMAPLPAELASVKPSQLFGNNYASCIKVPYEGLDFIFASVSEQASLSNLSVFRPASEEQLGSVICLTIRNDKAKITSAACAIPPAFHVAPNYSALLIGFPMGLPSGLSSFGDLLKANMVSAQQPGILKAQGGDYPLDEGAMLQPVSEETSFSLVMSRSIYDWLRSVGVGNSTTLKSILAASNAPLVAQGDNSSMPVQWLAFYVDDNGQLQKRLFYRNPFHEDLIADQQMDAIGVVNTNPGAFQVNIIDNVRDIGSRTSGKHGGQAIDISFTKRYSRDSQPPLVEESVFQQQFTHGKTVLPAPKTLKLAVCFEFLDRAVIYPQNTIPNGMTSKNGQSF